jgi:hypothetical protein
MLGCLDAWMLLLWRKDSRLKTQGSRLRFKVQLSDFRSDPGDGKVISINVVSGKVGGAFSPNPKPDAADKDIKQTVQHSHGERMRPSHLSSDLICAYPALIFRALCHGSEGMRARLNNEMGNLKIKSLLSLC